MMITENYLGAEAANEEAFPICVGDVESSQNLQTNSAKFFYLAVLVASVDHFTNILLDLSQQKFKMLVLIFFSFFGV